MKGNVTLYWGDSAEDMWQGVTRPWFERCAAYAWSAPKPSIVLVPSRTYGAYLRGRLLQDEMSYAGIRIWTIGECRAHLLRRAEFSAHVAPRENLHLLLSLTAEGMPDQATAQSVARDPSGLMRALDLLSAAGHSASQIPLKQLRPVIGAFERSRKECGWMTIQEAEQALSEQFSNALKPIANLLVTGFDGSHWDHWQSLRCMVAAADYAVVALTSPRSRAEQIDQIWIGSWEELYGPATPIEARDDDAKPFADLADGMECGQSLAKADIQPVLHIGRHFREQAHAIVTQAMLYLSDPRATRVGVLFPRYGALSREVAGRLARHDIVFHDGLGFHAPVDPSTIRWRAWLALQRYQLLEGLLDFVLNTPGVCGDLPGDALKKALDEVQAEILVDDLAVMRVALAASHRASHSAAAAWFSEFILLPQQDSLKNFLALTRRAMEMSGLRDRLSEVDFCAASLPSSVMDKPCSRAAYLNWLEAGTDTPRHLRGAGTNNPYARLQLLTYDQAADQSWSHLILTDMNQNHWPPPQQELAFLREDTIDELNRRAVIEGAQGSGHLTVRNGMSYILGPTQRRTLVQRRFYSLLESVRHGLCITASLTDESDPSRRLLPGDLLTHLYFTSTGRPLSDKQMDAMRETTCAWLDTCRPAVMPPESDRKDLRRTIMAYERRRDETQPFGPYEFALDRPPVMPISLSCKQWEDAIASPAIQWMKSVLGIEDTLNDNSEIAWALTTGSWVHRWLQKAIAPARQSGFAPYPPANELVSRTEAAAALMMRGIAEVFTLAGRTLPEWWRACWEEALWIARTFALRLADVKDWPFAATEWAFPASSAYALDDNHTILLRGRMDLVLSDKADVKQQARWWIIDYKTGADKPLTARNYANGLYAGRGIQISLYALALAQAAANISCTLLTPNCPLEPQITIEDVLRQEEFWKGLCRMQNSGVFGMREDMRPEFGRGARWPIACLPIDSDILAAKWALTHPLLSKDLNGGEDDHD